MTKPDPLLTNMTQNAIYYGVPLPPYPMPKSKWEVTSLGLNVRSDPWVADNIIRTLPRGAEVTLLSYTSGGWGEIAPGEWCRMTFLKQVIP